MAHLPEESKLKFKLSKNFQLVALLLVVGGLVLTGLQFALPWHGHAGAEGHHQVSAHARLFLSMQLALLVTIPLSVGGIFFVAFNHLTGTFWNVTVRRLAENYFWFLPFVFILMAVIFFAGFGDVFSHWAHAAGDPVLAKKSAWLNKSFFIYRNLITLAVWFVFGFLFWKISVNQDHDGKIQHTRWMVKLGAMFLIVFGITVSTTGWDLSMSLEPHWFSTMWSVYIFAGLALTFYSSMIMWVWYLKKSGYYGDAVNTNHLHDLGKFMWGHTIFWAYIGFSQFMLIWYAHIPEETIFYHKRYYLDGLDMHTNAWAVVSWALVLVRFAVPFFGIIRRDAKRNLNYLASMALVVFIGQILDMYWIIYPTLDHGHFVMLNPLDLGPLFLMIGLFIYVVGTGLSRKPLIPVKDPRLERSLHWHQ